MAGPEVRVTVEVVNGFTAEGKERVLFTEELLLGYLSEGLDNLADLEEILSELEDEWAPVNKGVTP